MKFDIIKVRSRLLLDYPFLGTGAMHLELIEDATIPTLKTNGVWIKYNPEYMAGLTQLEQVFVLAHEVLHPLLLHPWRRCGRDLTEWNEACDYVINNQLVAAGLTAPANVLIDPQFDNMYAEQVFAKRRSNQPPPQDLPEEQPEEQPEDSPGEDAPGDQGSGAEGDQDGGDEQPREDDPGDDGAPSSMPDSPTGECVDGPEVAEEPGDLTAEDWEVIAMEAANVASAAGDLPGGMARALVQSRLPAVDWVAETREFVSLAAPSDVSWSRPNRRFIANGLYLPGPVFEDIGVLVVGIDVSGSVTQPMFDTFNGELTGLLREVRPEKLIVICVDTVVQAVYEFLPDEDCDVKLEMSGGGGTAFQPVFDYIEENAIDALAVIYLTDLDGPAPTEPAYPVLWVAPIYSTCPAPFGKHIQIP